MVHGIVIFFLVIATFFALVHAVAMALSLYWYYWWFDIFMHFWGGALIALGVHALATTNWFHIRPTGKTFLITFFVIALGWELFEWYADLYDPVVYLIDTTQDILLGLSGGLLTHFGLRTYRMK